MDEKQNVNITTNIKLGALIQLSAIIMFVSASVGAGMLLAMELYGVMSCGLQ